ncbi:MAG: hypothetical protein WAO02_03665 [Verrucomicrobiia bacterium]
MIRQPTKIKFLQVLLLAGCWLAAGCCSAASQPAPAASAGTKPRWHSVVMEPHTNLPPIHFYNKLNPVWWLGNIDEPCAPAGYRPNGSCRNFMWFMRNPFTDFTDYVIGVADKKTVRYGFYPALNGNPNGGWNFAVTRRRIVFLPFIDYKRHRFEFYFGWRERGNFGIKLNFRQKLPPTTPSNPESTNSAPLAFHPGSVN